MTVPEVYFVFDNDTCTVQVMSPDEYNKMEKPEDFFQKHRCVVCPAPYVLCNFPERAEIVISKASKDMCTHDILAEFYLNKRSLSGITASAIARSQIKFYLKKIFNSFESKITKSTSSGLVNDFRVQARHIVDLTKTSIYIASLLTAKKIDSEQSVGFGGTDIQNTNYQFPTEVSKTLIILTRSSSKASDELFANINSNAKDILKTNSYILAEPKYVTQPILYYISQAVQALGISIDINPQRNANQSLTFKDPANIEELVFVTVNYFQRYANIQMATLSRHRNLERTHVNKDKWMREYDYYYQKLWKSSDTRSPNTIFIDEASIGVAYLAENGVYVIPPDAESQFVQIASRFNPGIPVYTYFCINMMKEIGTDNRLDVMSLSSVYNQLYAELNENIPQSNITYNFMRMFRNYVSFSTTSRINFPFGYYFPVFCVVSFYSYPYIGLTYPLNTFASVSPSEFPWVCELHTLRSFVNIRSMYKPVLDPINDENRKTSVGENPLSTVTADLDIMNVTYAMNDLQKQTLRELKNDITASVSAKFDTSILTDEHDPVLSSFDNADNISMLVQSPEEPRAMRMNLMFSPSHDPNGSEPRFYNFNDFELKESPAGDIQVDIPLDEFYSDIEDDQPQGPRQILEDPVDIVERNEPRPTLVYDEQAGFLRTTDLDMIFSDDDEEGQNK